MKKNQLKKYFPKTNVDGIPKAHYFGQEGLHNIMVVDLLGPSLEDMFDYCGRKFSVKCVCMLAKQMVIYPFKEIYLSERSHNS